MWYVTVVRFLLCDVVMSGTHPHTSCIVHRSGAGRPGQTVLPTDVPVHRSRLIGPTQTGSSPLVGRYFYVAAGQPGAARLGGPAGGRRSQSAGGPARSPGACGAALLSGLCHAAWPVGRGR